MKERRYSRQQISHMKEDQLRSVIRSYAKTANQRLRELEKQGLSKASNAHRYVTNQYNLGDKIYSTDSSGRAKFNTNLRKVDLETLRREALELDTFLHQAKTSSVKGTRNMYQKTLNELQRNDNPLVAKFFKNMSIDDMGEFWENATTKQWIKMYGSEVVIEIYQKVLDNNSSVSDFRDVAEIMKNIVLEDNRGLLTIQDEMVNYPYRKDGLLSSSDIDQDADWNPFKGNFGRIDKMLE